MKHELNSRHRQILNMGASVMALTLVCAAPVAAQESPTGATNTQTPPSTAAGANGGAVIAGTGSGNASNDGRLEEIIVTARKTSENLQTTPISVSSLSATALTERNVTNVQQLARISPNLMIVSAPSNGAGTIAYIRGIGAIGSTADADPPTTIYIDGVVSPRPTGNAFDLPDLDRIEVLRGPQGTLFGRNTTGGAIVIYTSKPTEEFGGKGELDYGRFNEHKESIVLNTGALGGSTWKAKFTFSNHDSDGYINTFGRDKSNWAGYSRNTAASFTLEGKLSDAITVNNRIDYNHLNALPAYQLVLLTPAAQTYFSNSPNVGGRPLLIGRRPIEDQFYIDPRRQFDPNARSWSDTFNVVADISEAFQLKSITGYRNLHQNQSGQLGGSALRGVVANPVNPASPVEDVNPLVTPYDFVKQDQISEELQATGKVGDFNYVAGLYYFDEHATDSITVVTNAPNATGTASTRTTQVRFFDYKSRSMAAYGQVNYKPAALDEKLELSGGLRYTRDHKDELRQTRVNGTLIGPDEPSKTWTNLGWSASASYRWTDEVMTYVRGSSGYRAGGFNATQIGSPAFNPEKAIAVEAGAKADLFDRHVRLNGDVFKTFYKDLQILQRDAVANTNFTTNAAKATYTGFEFEGTILPGAGLQLDGSVGYTDPKYKEYIFITAAGRTDISNVARFPLLAKWTWNVGAQWSSDDTAIGVITPRVEYSYRSSFVFQPVDALSPNNLLLASGVQRLLNARLTISKIPLAEGTLKNLSVQFYGQNLTNNRTFEAATDLSYGGTASFSRPRTYGVRLLADF